MVDLLMLLCALIAAMAFGIFAAYGILRVAFALMRPRRLQPVKPISEIAPVS